MNENDLREIPLEEVLRAKDAPVYKMESKSRKAIQRIISSKGKAFVVSELVSWVGLKTSAGLKLEVKKHNKTVGFEEIRFMRKVADEESGVVVELVAAFPSDKEKVVQAVQGYSEEQKKAAREVVEAEREEQDTQDLI